MIYNAYYHLHRHRLTEGEGVHVCVYKLLLVSTYITLVEMNGAPEIHT